MAVQLRLNPADQTAFDDAVTTLVGVEFASRMAAQDPTLWGPEAEDEAAKRLAWVSLAETSRHLVPVIEDLRDRLRGRGLDHVVLCGMGGSSLAPEVICATESKPLHVLDSSDPDYVRASIATSLAQSIVVVSSKSGSTVETDSQRRAYEAAFEAAGLEPRDHFVIVTDPGSPLDAEAREKGYTVINADPDVGGRYSALTAFGLVPCGLAGVDVGRLLDQAAAIEPDLQADDRANPALQLGAFLATANAAGVDKVVLADDGSGLQRIGDWAEQLIAESTGKQGRGILPVVVSSLASANATPNTPDEVILALGDDIPPASSGWAGALRAPLGAALLLWEYAIPVAGSLIGINPFDQPDVESAKAAARSLLDGNDDHPEPVFSDGSVDVFATEGLLDGRDAATLEGALETLFGEVDPSHGYLAVMAYVDRDAHADLSEVRKRLALRIGRPTTFGWGPRFLHSTGQYHKGGAPTGVFLQSTADPVEDLEIPGRPFTFGSFIHAQAVGDASVLAAKGRPVLRLHVRDAVGFKQITDAIG
ncbi:MAG: glucose-6-phosphate isomerase [Marmoricola sp.]